MFPGQELPLQAMEHETLVQQGHVEGLPVVADPDLVLAQPLPDQVEERWFFVKVASEELLDLEGAVHEPRQPHQKRDGAGSARQSGGLGVQKEALVREKRFPFARLQKAAERPRVALEDLANRDLTVVAVKRHLLDHAHARSQRRLHDLAPGDLPVRAGLLSLGRRLLSGRGFQCPVKPVPEIHFRSRSLL